MGLEILWSKFAEDKLQDIFYYYKYKVSLKTARKIINETVDKTIDLDKNPKIGQIEELLAERPQEFRYLVTGNYKIIYYINFDTRRKLLQMYLIQDKILKKLLIQSNMFFVDVFN
ncbi:type II toxin-antitoxin system RelE/ParE family toxin [Flavobacterium sp. xlx-214]|uniref:type II toxin-antitoxin system RelE/ParE family toxin n=1 Tax=unclassified Flavobacterium TaxID=196869 RepID=UPI0013D3D33C|nr:MULTISPECIES: type II toxin-antitoxin system RelE/ParE family toxin [unclassified Flavobacterium]MBA5791697.1 type II toxin-antitoxin system RelE/ParE family toxin [Flavobacterium sp. xlx-221]QMI82938.1 type II toxin-antitoxin system RelE/ParE family toxin [Flavobacterium sp. xlx-214]